MLDPETKVVHFPYDDDDDDSAAADDYDGDDDWEDDETNDYCSECGHQTVYSFEEGGRICYKHGLQ